MKYIYIVLSVLVFFGCSSKEAVVKPTEKVKIVVDINETVQDLIDIPQDITYYTKNINEKYISKVQKNYEKAYFTVWNFLESTQTLEDVKWPFKYFNTKKNYIENLQPVDESFFMDMEKKSNFIDYKSINKKGLTLKYANLRALPTSSPLLMNPSLAGEGFPFDYLQNSGIHPNTPLFISHYSKDKQWVFVYTSFTYGWLKSDEVVEIQDEYASLWQNAQQVYITKEGIPLFTSTGEALYNTRIGMLFALVDESEDDYTVLSISSYKGTQAKFNTTKISKDIATKELLSFNKENINKIITEVSKTKYGWGGLFEQRDCSSTTMDYFVPFGVYIPRNSYMQSTVGAVIDLSTLSEAYKIKAIKEKAIPFQTLFYKKGHILLYVGTYKEKIIVFHNVWGIKTKKDGIEGRFIIGKPVFSTLKIGSNLKYYDKDAELLKNIKSMNVVTR